MWCFNNNIELITHKLAHVIPCRSFLKPAIYLKYIYLIPRRGCETRGDGTILAIINRNFINKYRTIERWVQWSVLARKCDLLTSLNTKTKNNTSIWTFHINEVRTRRFWFYLKETDMKQYTWIFDMRSPRYNCFIE